VLKLTRLKVKFIMKKITTLALIICSAFLFSACSPKKDIENVASVTPTSSPNQEKSTFSLKELIAKNIAQKCTWTISSTEGDTTGEILINGNKFRQTIKIKNPMGETQFNGISDGEWMYTWSNDSTTGNMAFKMKLDEVEKPVEEKDIQTASGRSQINLDQELNYNCQPTVISEADLTVPKDIQFTDLNDFTKQFQQ
jgi:hypothetical protein